MIIIRQPFIININSKGFLFMAKKVVLIIMILLLCVGIGFFVYPTISDFVGQKQSESEIKEFDTKIENVIDKGSYEEDLKDGKINKDGYPIDENGKTTSDYPVYYKVDLDRLYKDSQAYNKKLVNSQRTLLDKYSYTVPSIDLSKYGIFDGVYGHISSSSIEMDLPIYLGANDGTMASGAAHMTYTSLPIGGKNTNCVLAAHTGYTGRTFFDNIFNLKKGDTVKITNFWGTLNYKVIETEVHVPSDSYRVYIEDGKDLLTLLTCISDGNGGFNRYYVICERV